MLRSGVGWVLIAIALTCVAVTPAAADTLVAPAKRADLAVHGDRVFWSDHRAAGLSRLMTVEGGAVTALRVRPEPITFNASPGTDRGGGPVLTYCRGTSDACRTLHVLDIASQRERRLDVAVPKGCSPSAPSMERGALVFILSGSCKRRGIWLRSATGRLWRLSANDNACCTALVSGRAAWIGAERVTDVVWIKVARPGRPPFTLYRSAPQFRGASTAGIVGHNGRLYWGVTAELTAGDFPRPVASRIFRARPVPGAVCEASDRTLPSDSRPRSSLSDDTLVPPRFAIGTRGLYYSDRTAIYIADAPGPKFGRQHVFGKEGCRL